MEEQVWASQVDRLSDIVDDFEIPVLCYGLRTDFTSHLFEGSKRLLEIADVIEEVPTVCWCGRRAHYNTRIKDGQVVRTGEQIMLGGNETYVSLCRNLLGCQKYLSRLKDLDAPAIIRLLYKKDVCKCSSCGGTEKRVTLTRSAVSGGS